MSEAPNMYPYLNNQQQFRFKNYFIAKIRERELMSKRLSKYIASFDYFDKSLIVFSKTSSNIPIASFAIVIGVPVGIPSASFSFLFLLTTGIAKIIKNNTK